jgi:hypothetical protein
LYNTQRNGYKHVLTFIHMTIISNTFIHLYIHLKGKMEFYSRLGKINSLNMDQDLHYQIQTNLIKYIQNFLLVSPVYG